MARKRALIVEAAHRAFLDTGYAETTMNRIANAAGVSIKTVYRHFDNKDDLFVAVMQNACSSGGLHDLNPNPCGAPPWFELPPAQGLQRVCEIYLRHILEDQQIALFRVVIQDAPKFPELAKRYRQEMFENRDVLFARYLERWRESQHWRLGDSQKAAGFFAGLLRSNLLENALLGKQPGHRQIMRHAAMVAGTILAQLKNGSF